MDKKRPIDLFLDVDHRARKRGIMKNVPPAIRDDIRVDLERVVWTRHEGEPIPSLRDLQLFFKQQYNHHVACSSIGEWMATIERELFDDKETSD